MTTQPSFLSLTETDRILSIVKNQQTVNEWITSELSKTVNERFKGLRTYFHKVESFNRKKSNADVAYINGEIVKYSQEYSQQIESLSTEFGNNVGKIINFALATMSAEAAEDATQAVMKAVIVMNPLEKIFGGSSVGDYFDRNAKLAHTITKITEALRKKETYKELITKTLDISTKLNSNSRFLENVLAIAKALPIWKQEKNNF